MTKSNSVVWGVIGVLLILGGLMWTLAQAINAPPYYIWMLVAAGILVVGGVIMMAIAWRGEKWINL